MLSCFGYQLMLEIKEINWQINMLNRVETEAKH